MGWSRNPAHSQPSRGQIAKSIGGICMISVLEPLGGHEIIATV
ncbi:hypothetical protein [Rubritalea tangerina]